MAPSDQTLPVQSKEYAVSLDAQDPLFAIRNEFHIPTKTQLKAKSLPEAESCDTNSSPDSLQNSIYLCGNSLGLQPKLTSIRMQQYFTTWATQGVFGHFKSLDSSPLPTWLDADVRASEAIAPIVGADPSEVAVMETLTANLHLLMSAFYKPDVNGRHKIIIENQAFPSDHFAAESQILHHNLSPSTSLITISEPGLPQHPLSTSHILSIINQHASTTSILLLPGIQFYTGQFLDIPTITAAAHSAGIFVIWDLAHAVGNVELKLHDWNVDAAVWCSYKYLNSGPGSAGGLFIHSNHTPPLTSSPSGGGKPQQWTNRLSGWWGSDKSSRFTMDNKFFPSPGASGFQLSNPSIFDLTSITASLEIFSLAGGLPSLRTKSIKLTAYLESLLLTLPPNIQKKFTIITPKNEGERGAQLSLKLKEGLLEVVMKELEERGVVIDERKPDVVRVAPAPLYNGWVDCWEFVGAFKAAIEIAVENKEGKANVEGTRELEMTS